MNGERGWFGASETTVVTASVGRLTVTRSGPELQIQVGPRTFPLQALPDGSFAVGGGLIVTLPVRFAREADGIIHMELVGLETVRRTNGLTP